MDVAAIALVASIVIAFVMLARQRDRTRPEDPESETKQPVPKGKRERMMAKLEPLPEIPTVMDLVRQEVEETGVENIPGHEGLSGPVMLKVFKRDQAVIERCTHDAYEFVIEQGVAPEDALEANVTIHCDQCGEHVESEPMEPIVEPKEETTE